MSITDHISEARMHSFCSGTLPATDTLICAEHLEACSDCSRLFHHISLSGKFAKANRSGLSPEAYLIGEHLDFEQISDYLDNQLKKDESDAVKLHLESCTVCSVDLSSLREFRESIDNELVQDITRKSISGFWKPKLPAPAYVFGTLSILMLLGLLAIFLWQSQGVNRPGQDQVAVIPTPQPTVEVIVENPTVRQKPGKIELKRAEIIYDNGKRFVVSYQGNRVQLSNLAPELRPVVVKALQGQPVGSSDLLSVLAQPEMSARSGEDRKDLYNLLSPIGTLLAEDRPVFRWRPIDGATAYVVDIVDESFNPVAQSPRLESMEWALNQNLKRGSIYTWQVTAYSNGAKIESKINSIARFMVISEKKLNEIQAARKKYTSHLEIGLYYLREGLLEEAEREFRELQSRNPASKPVKILYRRIQTGEEERIRNKRT